MKFHASLFAGRAVPTNRRRYISAARGFLLAFRHALTIPETHRLRETP